MFENETNLSRKHARKHNQTIPLTTDELEMVRKCALEENKSVAQFIREAIGIVVDCHLYNWSPET